MSLILDSGVCLTFLLVPELGGVYTFLLQVVKTTCVLHAVNVKSSRVLSLKSVLC